MDGYESSREKSKLGVDTSVENLSSNMESIVPNCIRNSTCLVENILHNIDTWVFVDKNGIEAMMQLFDLPLLPLSFPGGQNTVVAFNNFSLQHSSPLTRVVCTNLREHKKLANEFMVFLAISKLEDIEVAQHIRILRCLSSLDGISSFSTHLLKRTTTMMHEIGYGDAYILKDVGMV